MSQPLWSPYGKIHFIKSQVKSDSRFIVYVLRFILGENSEKSQVQSVGKADVTYFLAVGKAWKAIF